MIFMRPLNMIRTACLISALVVSPVAAQDAAEEEGRSLMEEGARLFSREYSGKWDQHLRGFVTAPKRWSLLCVSLLRKWGLHCAT